MLPAGDQDDEDGRNYRPKHVELIEIINTIIIVAPSCLFILAYVHLVTKLIMLGTTTPNSVYTCMAAKVFPYLFVSGLLSFPQNTD